MSLRFERANSEIKRCLSEIIQLRMNNPHLNPMLYVSEVDISRDFKYCKVKVALDTQNEDELNKNLQILQNAEGFIKRELANMVKMPSIPKLSFEVDKGTSATIRINEILKNLNIPKEEDENNE